MSSAPGLAGVGTCTRTVAVPSEPFSYLEPISGLECWSRYGAYLWTSTPVRGLYSRRRRGREGCHRGVLTGGRKPEFTRLFPHQRWQMREDTWPLSVWLFNRRLE
jgi:hypothetical protein